MIIAYDTPGQLGNQLWAYTNVIAIAKELKVSVCIILQSDYYFLLDEASLLAAKKNKIYIYNATSFKGKFIKRIVSFFTATNKLTIRKAVTALLPVSIINEANTNSLVTLQSTFHFSLVNAWQLRLYKNAFLQQSNYIRQLILPEINSKVKATDNIAYLKSKFDVVVAVHIRRGDYKYFEDGKHYFDDDFYRNKMIDMVALLAPATVCFSIFSNEQIQLNNFKGIHAFFDSSNTPIGDMWAISKCDYIIGPLSTFSMWASFWNKVPLQFLSSTKAITSLSDCKYFIAQDVQQND